MQASPDEKRTQTISKSMITSSSIFGAHIWHEMLFHVIYMSYIRLAKSKWHIKHYPGLAHSGRGVAADRPMLLVSSPGQN